MNKKFSVFLVLTILVAATIPSYNFASSQKGSSSLIPNAYASSFYELKVGNTNLNCEVIGGTWTSPTNTCILSSTLTLNSGDSLIVDPSVTLTIKSSGNVINSGNLSNNGTISYAQMTNKFGGTINNFGTIRTNMFFSNLYNNGTINNGKGATIRASQGSVEYNFNSGVINNSGTITDTPCAVSCQSDSVTIYNDNIINNNSGGKISNAFHFVNNPGGFTGATINNNAGSTFTNHFIFYQQGIVINSGIFTNNGDVTPFCGNKFTNIGGYFGTFPDVVTGC